MSVHCSLLALSPATTALTAETVNSLSSCPEPSPSQRDRRKLLVKSASSPSAWEERTEGPGFRSSFRAKQIKCCLGCGFLVLPKDAPSAAFTYFGLLMETAIKACDMERGQNIAAEWRWPSLNSLFFPCAVTFLIAARATEISLERQDLSLLTLLRDPQLAAQLLS